MGEEFSTVLIVTGYEYNLSQEFHAPAVGLPVMVIYSPKLIAHAETDPR